jgi:bacillithiol biosynthesis deacetylase BshB1
VTDIDLLAIGAHPDDVELSCGGWLALAGQRGQTAVVLDLSRGELATNGTVELRAREAAAAAEILGLADRRNLGLPDGGIRAHDDAQVDALVGQIRDLRPGLLLAPHTEARHPDHAEAGALCRRAVFLAGLRQHRPDLGAPWRPRRILHYPQRHEVRPELVVDISSVVDVKARAVAAHESQFGAGAATLINRPLGLSAWDVRDRYWGASIGVAHGEPYLLGSPVPVSDPVAHFDEHDEVPVLVPTR